MGGRICTTSVERCQHSDHQQKKQTQQNVLITEVYLFFPQPARSLIGSYCTYSQTTSPQRWCQRRIADFVRTGAQFYPATTLRKMHRPRSTSVYSLCRLHEGIQHRWEDWTVAAAEEIWMHRKVHNHDGKSVYRNDGQIRNAIANGVKQGCVLAPMLSLSSYQKCPKILLEKWGRSLHPITPECIPLYSRTLQSEDKKRELF